jgi:hypothetical protein
LISIGFSNSSIEWEISGFGTRWVVQSQIRGDAALNYDPTRGAVKAPLVLWGPYLWACGTTPRKRGTWLALSETGICVSERRDYVSSRDG